ncbi:ribosomal protein S18-alanine N-acetyltransferase [Shewanella fodinae]|jgi:ribosomal-protein-alanine N-acetyltransferase|uniref:[Ribosomal protein bS18]-alanine N-acetyltransferase n=1 Tax=Shewanella fodinae TaxID=552357 RepID=A0A4R2EZM8_9GAMM|nr:ribosomal protein S18-alanine N-acetyltransferase [Shewanella fodinae]TCN76317.1 [SSU ribosomal protein S18P]-alanine acetyltransferase [Shewanella fodinae]
MAQVLPISLEQLPQMLAVEQLAHPYPWDEATLKSCFGRFYQQLGLFDDDEQLIGFSILQCLFEEATLMNICVMPSYQGKGFGKLLLEQTIASLKAQHIEVLLLEVRVSNTAAIGLYRHLGFIETGSRRNYYHTANGREDALLMELRLHCDIQA